MLIVTALNVTGGPGHRKDLTAKYEVEVAINHAPPIFKGIVDGHYRPNGAAVLLRRIADAMDAAEEQRDTGHLDGSLQMLERIRGTLQARAEGRHEGGDVEVMHFVDLIVQREGGCKR